MVKNTTISAVLESLWPFNKAKGQIAQVQFRNEVDKNVFGTDVNEKILPGCWLLAPSGSDFYKFRFCFFVHPKLAKDNETAMEPKDLLGDKYRPFHAVAEFLNNAGIGVLYVVASTKDGLLPLEAFNNKIFDGVNWKFFSFENGAFIKIDADKFFDKWQGRGRASFGKGWDGQIRARMDELGNNDLTAILLNELFFTGFIKSVLKKPVSDPYDIDEFCISISQKHIFPMEIKEKFAGQNGKKKFFGIDAGRIMMLLRICIPNDANAIYLIRELDESGKFIDWKYITLGDIIMTSSWNLQAGGRGMGGQDTQTIRLPYEYFKSLKDGELSEENLKKIGSLPRDVKDIAISFKKELESGFYKK